PDVAAAQRTAAALTDRLAGPQPRFKPAPPTAAAPRRTAAPDTAAPARRSSPLAPGGGAIPVATRSLDDVLADLTRRAGNAGGAR
ncbi:MAG: hypothetical protein VW644_07335, partial [Alphaproteobacteria bacterium]